MLIYDDDILDRVILLLSAIIPFLFFWITWSIYWSFRSIMEKKGEHPQEVLRILLGSHVLPGYLSGSECHH
jgi:hypothetical protein